MLYKPLNSDEQLLPIIDHHQERIKLLSFILFCHHKMREIRLIDLAGHLSLRVWRRGCSLRESGPDPEHPHDTIMFPNTASRESRFPGSSQIPYAVKRFRVFSNLATVIYPENSLPDTGHSIESKWSAEFQWFYRTQSLWSLDSLSLQSVIVRWRTLLPRYKSRIPNSLKCLWLFLRSEYSKKFAACLFDPHSFPTILN